MNPSTWKAQAISIHLSIFDEFFYFNSRLKQDKRQNICWAWTKPNKLRYLQNVENPTCVLDSAEEHLLTLCWPRNGETQITGCKFGQSSSAVELFLPLVLLVEHGRWELVGHLDLVGHCGVVFGTVERRVCEHLSGVPYNEKTVIWPIRKPRTRAVSDQGDIRLKCQWFEWETGMWMIDLVSIGGWLARCLTCVITLCGRLAIADHPPHWSHHTNISIQSHTSQIQFCIKFFCFLVVR